MSYTVNTTEDVYKYTQVLFDYLAMYGHKELAESLAGSVDGCFANSEQALKAHKQALLKIHEHDPGLPPEHRQALTSSLEILYHV